MKESSEAVRIDITDEEEMKDIPVVYVSSEEESNDNSIANNIPGSVATK